MSDKTTNDDDVDAGESNKQGSDAIASDLAAASATASMTVATTSNETTAAATAKEEHVSMGTLWDTLQHEFTQMGRALSCPLCLSTYTDAVILPCVHAYCRECLCDAFKNGQPRCPTCLTRATKRSMVAAPQLQRLVRTYKLALRQFGLVPVTYDPSYQAMTQLAPGDNATAFGGDGEGLTVQIREGGGGRRKSSDLVEHHIQLQVSRTWQRVLQERQEEDQARAERFAAARERQQRQSRHSIGKGNAKSTTTAASTASAKFGAEWYQQQQASVIASHERALIDAARRKAPPTTSQQMEGNMENALEQEMANQQMEDDDDNDSDENHDDNLDSNEQENEQNEEEDTTHHHLDFVTTRPHRGDLSVTTTMDGNDNNLGAAAATTNTISGGDETQESGVFFTASESQQTNNTAATTATTTAATTAATAIAADQNKQKESQRPFLSMAESFDTAMSTTGGEERESKTVHIVNNNVDTYGDGGDEAEDGPSAVDTVTAKNDKAEESEKETLLQEEQAQQFSTSASRAVSSTRQNASFETATPLQSNTGSRVFHFSNTVGANNNNHRVAHTAPSNSSGDTEQEVTRDHATSTNESSDTTSSNTSARAEFKVGDIVQVQSRTWPGVNKPGGIARISKVFENTSSYHVNYILGGKEKNVDSIFLSLPPEEMNLLEDAKDDSNNAAASASTTDNNSNKDKRERKSRRISKFDAKVKMEAMESSPVHKNVLPPDLMKQLAAEGFDVAPLAIKTASSKSRSRYSTARVTFNTEASERPKNAKRSRSAPRSGTAAASGASSTTKRARQTAKTNPPLQEQNPTVQAKKDAQKRNAPTDDNVESENGKPAAKKSAPSKRRKKAPSASSGQQDIALVPPLPETNPEICALADKYYQERVQRALDNNSLCVVSTGLSDSEKKALKALIREAKQCGDGESEPVVKFVYLIFSLSLNSKLLFYSTK